MPSKARQQKKLEEEMRRKEELQRKAQEAAEKLFKQHEKERINTEKADRTKRDQELQQVMLERDRLQKEKKEYSKLGSDKKHRLSLALREHEKYKYWETIVADSWLPCVTSEAELNAFLSTWEEDDNSAGEDSKRNLQHDFMMIGHAHDLIQLILLEQDAAVTEEATGVKGAKKKVAFHRQSLLKTYALLLAKLDELTANILNYLDKYVDRDEEQGITLCRENAALRYGLWAGDKRPRHRGIDYREIGVSIGPKEGAYVPKALDLVKDRGIRVMQLNIDPMSLRGEEDGTGAQYQALGCVLFIEVLQYPRMPIQVKEWTMRHEQAQLAGGLRRHAYPPVSQGADLDAAKPVKVSFVVPPHVVVRHLAPFIGVWSPEENVWQMTGTSDFDYKRDTRTVTFATQHLSCLAIIQERGFDVPYEEWSLVPQSADEVLLTIEGKRRGEISDREVQILIRNNQCKIVAPDEAELDALREGWFAPSTLLRQLARSGYQFVLSDADADFFPDVLPKSRKMELAAYEDMANFASVYCFSSSRHNAARAGLQPGVTCEDPGLALFRVAREMRPEDSTAPYRPENDDSKWWTMRYGVETCCITQCKEAAESADITAAPGETSHLNLYMCLTSRADEAAANEIRRRYDNGNPLLHSAVFDILALVRPLSFG